MILLFNINNGGYMKTKNALFTVAITMVSLVAFVTGAFAHIGS